MSDIRQKFNLERQNESVDRLAELVRNSDSVSTDDVVKIISSDERLCKRTLRMAYPSYDEATDDVDLEAAINRLGVGVLLILTIGDLMGRALLKTFGTMVDMDMEVGNPYERTMINGPLLVGTVDFAGRAKGSMCLSFQPELSQSVAQRLLGTEDSESLDDEMIRDAVGELVNIVAGNLQSNLSNAELGCKVEVPVVEETVDVTPKKIPGARPQVFVYTNDGKACWVHLLVNPYGG